MCNLRTDNNILATTYAFTKPYISACYGCHVTTDSRQVSTGSANQNSDVCRVIQSRFVHLSFRRPKPCQARAVEYGGSNIQGLCNCDRRPVSKEGSNTQAIGLRGEGSVHISRTASRESVLTEHISADGSQVLVVSYRLLPSFCLCAFDFLFVMRLPHFSYL